MTDHGLPYLEAPDLDLPVLATCRGMPLFNVAHGGTLVQHIDGHRVPFTTSNSRRLSARAACMVNDAGCWRTNHFGSADLQFSTTVNGASAPAAGTPIKSRLPSGVTSQGNESAGPW